MGLLTQTPAPGSHVVLYRGDRLEVKLQAGPAPEGQAYLRTNIGHARTRRREIVEHVEEDRPILARDWHDWPMRRVNGSQYALALPLLESGRFEAKAFLLPKPGDEPIWPAGGNVVIKVEPAEYCCSNCIYTAFVRQFRRTGGECPPREEPAQIEELERLGYAVIPHSGTFRDLIRQLDFIMGELHFRIVQLLPIFPTPTTYARMGRFGSPFAALDFKDVDPALAEFDRQTTPLDQFRELVDAIHERRGKLFLDIPVNHTGWASKLQVDHPEWFVRGKDRQFESPGAWGVTWEDLSKLDYRDKGLWRYMADVFRFWCREGVDGFRCDAGYMVPFPVWEYLVAKVRREFPDTVFLLEGLGGTQQSMEKLLDEANLDWAYSELFQNYDRGQVESHLSLCARLHAGRGLLVHFAETHDNNRLASRSPVYARMRTALSALCSYEGAYGITNGVEWFATEKIDVHGAPSMNWGSDENQVEHLRRLNALLEEHPGFHPGARLSFIQQGHENSLAIVRQHPAREAALLILANLDDRQPTRVAWRRADSPVGEGEFPDLLGGRRVTLKAAGELLEQTLAPGEVVCLGGKPSDLQLVDEAAGRAYPLARRAEDQRLRAKAMELFAHFRGLADCSGVDVDDLARQLRKDPLSFCAALAGRDQAPVAVWEWPRDERRTVMVPPGSCLLIRAAHRFAAELQAAGGLRRETSMKGDDGREFGLILPLSRREPPCRCVLSLIVYVPGDTRRVQAPVLYLPKGDRAQVQTSFTAAEVAGRRCYALCTNGRGGMAQVRGAWGEIQSQYDAILAGNLHPLYPVDRRIMFTRCRAWLVYQGYSCTLNRDCLDRFSIDEDGGATWRFRAPAGRGKLVGLSISLHLVPGCNAVRLDFQRQAAQSDSDLLPDAEAVRLILRPDIEDRVNHEKTKAYTGPEFAWPRAVKSQAAAFEFTPTGERTLSVAASPGVFQSEPEWIYMVAHPDEGERGLDNCSDLFSPGYFAAALKGGEAMTVQAELLGSGEGGPGPAATAAAGPGAAKPPQRQREERARRGPRDGIRLGEAMRRAMGQFVVRRGGHRTVIAGYPWFLDWGRDTLICSRGLIAAGLTDEAADILKQFAEFESHGTLPNMIRGGDASNRDTSDAPLWLFVACADLMQAAGSREFLSADCGGRTIREVLESIALSYMGGTPNGIRMDAESGLIFSPAHFTWMDTNHPAGTPRQGYPVEIQALWHAALRLLSVVTGEERWQAAAGRVRTSLERLYAHPERDFLSDCLHAGLGQAAGEAKADDALRPNQLLAITLGALTDRRACSRVLRACEELLVPGAIRSLADRPVVHPLAIWHNGRLLNDPAKPYWGNYRGDEDTRRKPAYHNGTAWTWLFPSFCEALYLTHGAAVRDTALSILGSSTEAINGGCVGQVPEILDGDTPHASRGCGAQAWGVTELYRVLAILQGNA